MKKIVLTSVLGLWSLALIPAYAGNIIIGPPGLGAEHWVAASDPLDYEIRFENPASAAKPVQNLSISNQLDSNLDFSTFRFGDFGFGNVFFDIPDNQSFFTTRIDLKQDLGFHVDVTFGFNVAMGEALWEFGTIDPETGSTPLDPSVGFLFAGDEGLVQYSVKPVATVVTGDVIEAKARMVFHYEDPIDTPQIFNTINTALNPEPPPPNPVPEPSTLLLFGTGVLGLFRYARRKR